MSIPRFLSIVRSRWMYVVAAVVACVLVAVAATLASPKVYEARTSFYVSMSGISSANDAFQATQTAQFRLSSYAKIAASTEVAEKAIKSLGLDLDPGAVASTVKIDYAPQAVVFGITVSDSDPNRVVSLVNAMAEQFVALVPQLDSGAVDGQPAQQVSAKIIERPTRPDVPVSPNLERNVAMGLLAGLLLGALVALLREETDRSIRNAKRLERVYGSAPVAVVEAVMAPRGGDVAFGGSPEANARYRALRTRLLNFLESRTRAVYVTSPITVDATSIAAVDLAAALASGGETVVLVAVDPASTATSVLGFDRLSDAHRGDIARAIDGGLATSYPGLTIVDWSRDAHDVAALSGVMPKLLGRYDYVVVEGTPVLPDLDAGLQARQCGAALLLVEPDTRFSDLKEATAGLNASGASIFGVVLVEEAKEQSRWQQVLRPDVGFPDPTEDSPNGRRHTEPHSVAASGPVGSDARRASRALD